MRADDHKLRTVKGKIRRRLLVNALVDPDEAAHHLPPGVEPHVVDGATIVGCCLLELEALRPAWAPTVGGLGMRAAAHRVSCRWVAEDGNTVVGVYVPMRHTDARIATLAGGRLFPGVHRRAGVTVVEDESAVRWSVAPRRDPDFFIGVTVTPIGSVGPVDEPAGRACIDAAVGLSPRRNGVLEAVEMMPSHRDAQLVCIDSLESPFIDSFASAELAPSFLMADVDVAWTPGGSMPAMPELVR